MKFSSAVFSSLFIVKLKSVERWRQIKETSYQVSSKRNVRNKNGHLLKPMKGEYLRVQLTVDKKREKYLVHRLVAEAFIPNPENKLTVNHIDGDKYNNKLKNLEWATMKEQTIHAAASGLRKKIQAKSRQIIQLTKDNIEVAKFDTIEDASRETGVHAGNIGLVCREDKSRTSAGGFKWKFGDESEKDKLQIIIAGEIWKPSKMVPGLMVSNHGRIKSKGVIQCTQRKQYETVNCSGKHRYVHRLVADAFLDNPGNLAQVNHKDENRLNNHVDNLEWVSAKDNSIHSNGKAVLQHDMSDKFIRRWGSLAEAAKELKLENSGIVRACQGKYVESGGYIWKYE